MPTRQSISYTQNNNISNHYTEWAVNKQAFAETARWCKKADAQSVLTSQYDLGECNYDGKVQNEITPKQKGDGEPQLSKVMWTLNTIWMSAVAMIIITMVRLCSSTKLPKDVLKKNGHWMG